MGQVPSQLGKQSVQPPPHKDSFGLSQYDLRYRYNQLDSGANINGELVFPVADALHDAGIPFMIVTGYGLDHVPERHRARPFLQKPYKAAVLIETLARMLESGEETPQARPKSA